MSNMFAYFASRRAVICEIANGHRSRLRDMIARSDPQSQSGLGALTDLYGYCAERGLASVRLF
jgi:hypothetical protein